MTTSTLNIANQLLTSLLTDTVEQTNILASPQYQPLLQEAMQHQQVDWAAHMNSGLAPYSLLGLVLAAFHQGNLLSPELYPVLKNAETQTLDWLKKHFGQQHAQFNHSGTYSNLEALWLARERSNSTSQLVYGSRACHYSIAKACHILGLQFQEIDVDYDDCIDLNALKKACDRETPVAIVLNAGTSSLGSIDPLASAIELIQEKESWLHIDAAWGGSTMMLPENKLHYSCVNQADSISFDPHKSLCQPKPCSVLMLKHAPLVNNEEAAYLQSATERRLTGSRGGELFLPLWLNLQELGENWFYQITRQRLREADKFANQLQSFSQQPIFNGGSGIICFEAEKTLDSFVAKGTLSTTIKNEAILYRAVFTNTNLQADVLFKILQ